MRLGQVFYPVKLPLAVGAIWGPYKKSELLGRACDERSNDDMWALRWNATVIWNVIETKDDAHGAEVEAVVGMEVFGWLVTASDSVCRLMTCSVRKTASAQAQQCHAGFGCPLVDDVLLCPCGQRCDYFLFFSLYDLASLFHNMRQFLLIIYTFVGLSKKDMDRSLSSIDVIPATVLIHSHWGLDNKTCIATFLMRIFSVGLNYDIW
jgi:hypothetical protein